MVVRGGGGGEIRGGVMVPWRWHCGDGGRGAVVVEAATGVGGGRW